MGIRYGYSKKELEEIKEKNIKDVENIQNKIRDFKISDKTLNIIYITSFLAAISSLVTSLIIIDKLYKGGLRIIEPNKIILGFELIFISYGIISILFLFFYKFKPK